ncbi:hypothetical protein [Microcoleus sp. B9-D4]|uniref:hypothetical protein n=1 Tax=Microcoleus sp. B9-D4 TaxID=2818711 RepID=UPI002FD5F3D7
MPSQISKKHVTSAIARSNSTRYLLRYQDAIASQFVIQSRESVKGSSTLKNWEKQQKAPFFRELSDFRYCSKQKPYCAFGNDF